MRLGIDGVNGIDDILLIVPQTYDCTSDESLRSGP